MSEYGRMPNFDYHGFDWPGGPDYEAPPPPRCSNCGAFLPWDPDSQEPWEETIECDGSSTTSMEERTGEILAILGPGVDTYYWSACGSTGGDHQPHTEVMAAGVAFKWRCRKCDTLVVDPGR